MDNCDNKNSMYTKLKKAKRANFFCGGNGALIFPFIYLQLPPPPQIELVLDRPHLLGILKRPIVRIRREFYYSIWRCLSYLLTIKWGVDVWIELYFKWLMSILGIDL